MLNERRRHHDRPYDVQPVRGAALSDLDRRLFEETYLVSAFAPDVLEANERSYEQRLAATKMVATLDDPTPTVLGILVLGLLPRDFIPGAYVQFLRVAGDRPGDAIVDELVAEGYLFDVVRRVEDKLQSHNRVAVDFTSDAIERRQALYPVAALQQIVRNALMHRTYESTNSPVRISWYDDRVEIMNPGGPFGIVSAANFGMPGVADYRNPNLAEAMRVLGLVQRFGMGIATARRELQRNGNPDVEFAVHPNYVVATLRPPVGGLPDGDAAGRDRD